MTDPSGYEYRLDILVEAVVGHADPCVPECRVCNAQPAEGGDD
jgi:hypothetical protein